MRILEVVGLTCRVGGVAALDALSFTVEEGEIFALCGPAGAGKTLGLRCLAGSLPFESGRLIYDGREITGTDPRELARQGLVRVGEISMPPWSLAVTEAITLARRWPRWGPLSAALARWPGVEGRARDAALLERVGIAADARRRRNDLSAAGLARLELAQALALAPRVLLLDGPLGRLPIEDRPGMAALIASLRASGATVVLTEREPAVAEAVADRVATLGPVLSRMPDGETGERRRWIYWQRTMLERHPAMEVDPDAGLLELRQWDGSLLRRTDLLRFRPGVDPDSVEFPTGYAEAARASWGVFTRLRGENVVPPGLRFQICLPTAMSSACMYVSPRAHDDYLRVYERSLLRALQDITAAIPHRDLSIQWDICHEA